MTNTFVNTSIVNSTFEWTKIIALAKTQGQAAFEASVLKSDELSDEQLEQQAVECEDRFTRALEFTKRDCRDTEQRFLSALRNWARWNACKLLRAKTAGKPIRKDYLEVFECKLKDEIALRIMEIEYAWQTQDEQRAAAQHKDVSVRRAEQEQIFQNDHKPVLDVYNELHRAYTGREQAVHAGYELAEQWAEKLEKRMEKQEDFLGGLSKEMLGMYKDVHMQQRRENDLSFVGNAVQGGGKTLSCLFWLIVGCLVVFFSIFLAVQLAFHH